MITSRRFVAYHVDEAAATDSDATLPPATPQPAVSEPATVASAPATESAPAPAGEQQS